MKFFYALIVFLLGTYISFWSMVFFIPTPKVFDKDSFISSLNLTDREKQVAIPDISKSFEYNKINENYYFEQEIDKKRGSALFISSILTFFFIFIFIVVFYNRSHIIFPLIAAFTLTFILYSSLWIFNFTIGEKIYLDLQNIRGIYTGIKIFNFLGIYLAVLCLVLLFGSWYKLDQ